MYCEYSKLPPEGRGCRAEDGIETASPATENLHSMEKIFKNKMHLTLSYSSEINALLCF
jgi:hypothetical protein